MMGARRRSESGAFLTVVAILTLATFLMVVILIRDATRPRLAIAELQVKLDGICRTIARNPILQREGVEKFDRLIMQLQDPAARPRPIRYSTIQGAFLVMPTFPADGGFDANDFIGNGTPRLPGTGSATATPGTQPQQFFPALASSTGLPLTCPNCFYFASASEASRLAPEIFVPGVPGGTTQPFPLGIWDNGTGPGSVVGCGIVARVSMWALNPEFVTVKSAYKRGVSGGPVPMEGDGTPVGNPADHSARTTQHVAGLTIAVATEMTTYAHDPRFRFGPYTATAAHQAVKRRGDPLRYFSLNPGYPFNAPFTNMLTREAPLTPFSPALADNGLISGSPLWGYDGGVDTFREEGRSDLDGSAQFNKPPCVRTQRVCTSRGLFGRCRRWVTRCIQWAPPQSNYRAPGVGHELFTDVYHGDGQNYTPLPFFGPLVLTVVIPPTLLADSFTYNLRHGEQSGTTPPQFRMTMRSPTFSEPGPNQTHPAIQMGDRDELMVACSNPATVIRNAFVTVITELASRHAELRRATEILHVSPMHDPDRVNVVGNLPQTTFNHPVFITQMGDDLTRRAYELPYVSYWARTWSDPGGKIPRYGQTESRDGGWVRGDYYTPNLRVQPLAGVYNNIGCDGPFDLSKNKYACTEPSFTRALRYNYPDEYNNVEKMTRGILFDGTKNPEAEYRVALGGHLRLLNEQLRMCFHLYGAEGAQLLTPYYNDTLVDEVLNNDRFEPTNGLFGAGYKPVPYGSGNLRTPRVGQWSQGPYVNTAPAGFANTLVTAAEATGMLGTTQVCPFYQGMTGLGNVWNWECIDGINPFALSTCVFQKGWPKLLSGWRKYPYFAHAHADPTMHRDLGFVLGLLPVSDTHAAMGRFCAKPGYGRGTGVEQATPDDMELRPDVSAVVRYWARSGIPGATSPGMRGTDPVVLDRVQMPWGGGNYAWPAENNASSHLLYVTHRALKDPEVRDIAAVVRSQNRPITVVFIPTDLAESIRYRTLMEAFNAVVDPDPGQNENLFIMLSPFQEKYGYSSTSGIGGGEFGTLGTPYNWQQESQIFSRYWRYLLVDSTSEPPFSGTPDRVGFDETIVSIARSVFFERMLTYKQIL